MSQAKSKTCRSGFTLVELLVVIAIVSILMTLVMPAVHSTMDRGRRLACASNLRQIGVGFALWMADHDGYLPAYDGVNHTHNRPSENPNGYDVLVEIQLHMLGQHNLENPPNWSPHYEDGIEKVPSFICPADTNPDVLESRDMRRTSYSALRYIWQFCGEYFLSERGPDVSEARRLRLNPAWFHVQEAHGGRSVGPSGILIVSESSFGHENAWAPGQDPADPSAVLRRATVLGQNLRFHHNQGRGMNLLFLDGHVEFWSDFADEQQSHYRQMHRHDYLYRRSP